jgi:hypothetical protein
VRGWIRAVAQGPFSGRFPTGFTWFDAGTEAAYGAIMIDVALSILALIAGGLTLELFAAAWPPLAYNEQRGFNFRNKALDAVEELQIGNPS